MGCTPRSQVLALTRTSGGPPSLRASSAKDGRDPHRKKWLQLQQGGSGREKEGPWEMGSQETQGWWDPPSLLCLGQEGGSFSCPLDWRSGAWRPRGDAASLVPGLGGKMMLGRPEGVGNSAWAPRRLGASVTKRRSDEATVAGLGRLASPAQMLLPTSHPRLTPFPLYAQCPFLMLLDWIECSP